MKKFLKIFLWSVLAIIVALAALMGGFIYKIKYGFPVSYETDVPDIQIPSDRKTVLVFSKTTGFRHSESIGASRQVFNDMAARNNWYLYNTEEGGVFNPSQLAAFDVVIFNNSTGRVLNDEQEKALENYVEQGGSLIGIHGAGDDSHRWDWYEKNLMGAKFSHHPLNPQFQEADVTLNVVPDSVLMKDLPTVWKHTDEWYVFRENPRAKGFHILFTIDGEKINPNGNMLWITDKNFGMGHDHPVAWYNKAGSGRTFYTSMGHSAAAWQEEPFVRMLENAINR